MNDDQIENPAKQAQQIFGKSSIFEVMCLDCEAAIEALAGHYSPTGKHQLERCFAIVDGIKV
jgi:hypothetical protein